MKASLDPFMLATDLADYLVRKGVPFRETHHISGQCVAFSEKSKVPMDQMKLADFQAIDKRFGKDILECFNYESSVEFHSAAGGTAKKSVLEQVKVLKAMLQ
ncbi:Argininosuccinate lyase [Lachnellula suecica]|uniref:Argininosuccinate lyase n=1 Tax=Lachnellula suecica TaxID=602035 RepID=A0A8T9CD60_9HELO|nr:Argininosuccinate lyase [Lachnellula suecica]